MSKPELKKRNWKCVIYPQDLPPNWLELLEDIHVPMLVSPLHDKDVKPDGTGELKKPHRHVLVTLSGNKAYSEVLGWFAPLGVKIIKAAGDLRTEERYWCHLDSPSKIKYDIADLICLNGYECRFLGERFEMTAIAQIHDLIEELGIINYADLANEIVTSHNDLITTFLRYPAHWNNFCYARRQLLKDVTTADNNTYVKYRMGRKQIGR